MVEAKTLFDFLPSEQDELAFRKGDIVKIVNKDYDENWFKAELRGKEGFIPKNYVQLLPHPWFLGKISRKKAEDLVLQQPHDGAFLVRESESTLGDFSLSIKFREKAQHFKVLRDEAGKYFLYVVKFNSLNELIAYHRSHTVSRTSVICLQDMVDLSKRNVRGPDVGVRVQALYDFNAQEHGELSIKTGDVIQVLDKTDNNWWKGILHGREGYFPAPYVKAI